MGLINSNENSSHVYSKIVELENSGKKVVFKGISATVNRSYPSSSSSSWIYFDLIGSPSNLFSEGMNSNIEICIK